MDPDYQMALFLQEQFDCEQSFEQVAYDSDRRLATQLQEQFRQEVNVENPGGNLVYDKNNRRSATNTKSLVDPSWEVVDPTPDIHVLFMAFNERFFWNTLSSVCVSWSTRMTSCAGVCSYQGSGGLCKITLSEPLLKLRPRKDLVETLLHEMIHAYLFVTHNNRDRDGHGPEFHKHMYRINAEAGTNITVYHNFHDEVALYKQHWWRCNGPCRNLKPYYGLVKRSTNRPPGPNDYWWSRHSAMCGGTFIKVKEPEKRPTGKKNQKTTTVKGAIKGDIRNFIPNLNSTSKNSNTHSNNSNNNNNNNNKPRKGEGLPSNTTSLATNGNARFTVISAPKFNQVTTSNVQKSPSLTFVVGGTSPNRHIVGGIQTKPSDAYVTARNHWANKFNNDSSVSKQGEKRPVIGNPNVSQKSPKIKKDGPPSFSVSDTKKLHSENVECPVCGDELPRRLLNVHLDGCSKMTDKLKDCIICGIRVKQDVYEQHVSRCAAANFGDEFDKPGPPLKGSKESDIKECPICCKKINYSDFDLHMKECSKENLSGVIDLSTCDDTLEEKFCPVCEKDIDSLVYEEHAVRCLQEMYDKMEETYSNKQEKTKCVACNKDILKVELKSHLEDCMKDVFEDDDFAVPADISDNNRKHNCPLCMKEFEDHEMSIHIEECIETSDEPETQHNKTILLDSFSSDDLQG